MRLKLLLLLPLIVLLALFVASNTIIVPLSLWPTGWNARVPLALALLLSMAAAFLAGAVLVWLGGLDGRRRARRLQARLTSAEAELQALRGRAMPTPVTVP